LASILAPAARRRQRLSASGGSAPVNGGAGLRAAPETACASTSAFAASPRPRAPAGPSV